MGTLYYGASRLEVSFDDRALAHLQVVIAAKLRRGEPFAMSWKDDPAIGDGRSTIWLHPGVELHFKYSGSRPPALNRAWLDALAQSSNSTGGLYLLDEGSLTAPPESIGSNGHAGSAGS